MMDVLYTSIIQMCLQFQGANHYFYHGARGEDGRNGVEERQYLNLNDRHKILHP